MKKIGILFLTAVMALSFASCGEATSDYASYDAAVEEANGSTGLYEMDSYSDYDTTTEDSLAGETVSSERKLIKTYDLSLETESYDDLMTLIEEEVEKAGGYIESLDSSNGSIYYSYGSRYASITARIPAGKADSFLKVVGDNSNITNQSMNVEDVTLSYVDLQSKKDAYTAEQDRLMELLNEAETMDDIIALEDRLAEVRYELESMESQLRTYDNLVDYSTVNIYVDEVTVYTEPEPETFGERVASSFKEGLENTYEGLQNFIIWLVGAIPAIVILVVIVAVVLLIVFSVSKGKKKKAKKNLSSNNDNGASDVKPAASSYLKAKDENK